ncbi:hypothetical protein COO60DRAFT_704487 [Scenedesmus sp. NREL 46B-D3]|nr:hypothetical protein COO60DRAFT_704487 [Scenedesmus sp. NREL 46B-D3]
MQLLQQQQDMQMQQHELSCVRQQLLQVKEVHKRKMQQLKQQLKQQYKVQLQATTAAYAQELAQIQTHLAYSRTSEGLRASSVAAAPAAITAAGTAGQDMPCPNSNPAPRLLQQPEQQGTHGSIPVHMLTHQHIQQLQTQHQQQPHQHAPVPEEHLYLQQQQQQQQQQFQQQHQEQQQQQYHISCQDSVVPAEVLEYAERYQQGGEGSIRPPSAAPSMLQRQRCKEQPVPEAAAQLAQHFVAGGEGISRPLSAPSSDRCGMPPHQQQQQQQHPHHDSSCCSPQRSCRPSLRNSCEHATTAAASTSASLDLPAYILASSSLWDALCS